MLDVFLPHPLYEGIFSGRIKKPGRKPNYNMLDVFLPHPVYEDILSGCTKKGGSKPKYNMLAVFLPHPLYEAGIGRPYYLKLSEQFAL